MFCYKYGAQSFCGYSSSLRLQFAKVVIEVFLLLFILLILPAFFLLAVHVEHDLFYLRVEFILIDVRLFLQPLKPFLLRVQLRVSRAQQVPALVLVGHGQEGGRTGELGETGGGGVGGEGEVDAGGVLGAAVGGEVDVVLVDAGKAVEDEVGICLDSHHVVQGLFVQVLDHDQKLIAYHYLLPQLSHLDDDLLPLPHALLVDASMDHVRSASHLQDYLYFCQFCRLPAGVLGTDAGGVGDGESFQAKLLCVDEVSVGGVVDQVLEEGVLVLVGGGAALEVDGQQFVDLNNSLADAPSAGDEKVARQEDCAPYSSLLAVDVGVFSPGEGGLDLGDGLDEFVEGEGAVELEVEVCQCGRGVAFAQQLLQVVLVGVLADVDEQEGTAGRMFCQLDGVLPLREVRVEEPREDFGDGQGRGDAFLQLGVVGGDGRDQFRRVQALQDRIEREHFIIITVSGESEGRGWVKLQKCYCVVSYIVGLILRPSQSKYKLMSIRHLLSGLGKLALLYVLLAVLAELAIANYLAHQVSSATASPAHYREASLSVWRKVGGLAWEELWAVRGAVWVFRNRVYYCFLLLAGLALYYKYKERSLQLPPIAQRQFVPTHEYDANKRATTREEVAKLRQLPQYKQWERNPGKMRWSSPEDDQEWERAGRQIYDE